MVINIITPLTRPENLKAIHKSIIDRPSGIKVKWHIVVDASTTFDHIGFPCHFVFCDYVKWYDSDKGAVAGHAHRNMALENINTPNEWVMSLDDDNIIHPHLWGWLRGWIHYGAEADGIIWDQIYKNGCPRLNANRDDIKVYSVDTAQYMIKRGLIGNTRFQEDKYEADGIFIQEIYDQNRDSFIIVNQPLCYYNYLRS